MNQTIGEGKGRFRLNRRGWVGIVLLVVILAAVGVYAYYSAGVASVNGIVVEMVLVNRVFLEGDFPNRNVTYFFQMEVWSTSQYADARVVNPVFFTGLDGVRFGNLTMSSGLLKPESRLTYNLRHSINESVAPGTLSSSASHVTVIMTTTAIAGFYQQSITRGEGATWNWTTVTKFPDPL